MNTGFSIFKGTNAINFRYFNLHYKSRHLADLTLLSKDGWSLKMKLASKPMYESKIVVGNWYLSVTECLLSLY